MVQQLKSKWNTSMPQLPFSARTSTQRIAERGDSLRPNPLNAQESDCGWVSWHKAGTRSSHPSLLPTPWRAFGTWWPSYTRDCDASYLRHKTKNQGEGTLVTYWRARWLKKSAKTLYWPGMNAEITNFIQKCDTWMAYKSNQLKEPVVCHAVPSRP